MKKLFTFLFLTAFCYVGFAQPYDVTFNVDMTGATYEATDTIIITGSFTGWAEPGTNADYFLTDDDSDGIYTITLSLDAGEIQYKYFLNGGWDGGEWSGTDNRVFYIVGDKTFDDTWGDRPVLVTFNVDMTGATYVPATDSIFIAGSITGWGTPGSGSIYKMTDEDEDGIYTVTLSVYIGEIQYKYFLNEGWDGGEWTGDPNRVATIAADTTVNNEWGVISAVNDLQNFKSVITAYPNPFSDVIYIKYQLESPQDVTINIFNTLGQIVETINNVNSSAGKNTIAFDGSALSNGLYFYRIETDNDTKSGRIIKE